MKPPATADTPAKAQLFEGAMRLRYSVLLQKGLAMMEHTVTLAERTGEQSGWVLRAAESKRLYAELQRVHAELQKSLAAEKARVKQLEEEKRKLTTELKQ